MDISKEKKKILFPEKKTRKTFLFSYIYQKSFQIKQTQTTYSSKVLCWIKVHHWYCST